MERTTRRLGRSELRVSALGLGAITVLDDGIAYYGGHPPAPDEHPPGP